ncbi:MAG: phospholipase D-like domain-containing protein [Dehalococcoidia bacterium]|nr:phospholipase D-like domain-containing protein [Dehalococcoidia bacterium]
MSDIEVFFNDPEAPLSLERLLGDMRNAQDRLVVASAWFTNESVAQAAVESPAGVKLVLLNRSDLDRARNSLNVLKGLVTGIDGVKWDGIDSGVYLPRHSVIMHHKFVLCDNAVLWTGSYNFTIAARENYEALLRITEAAVVKSFWVEAVRLCRRGFRITDEWRRRGYPTAPEQRVRETLARRRTP